MTQEQPEVRKATFSIEGGVNEYGIYCDLRKEIHKIVDTAECGKAGGTDKAVDSIFKLLRYRLPPQYCVNTHAQMAAENQRLRQALRKHAVKGHVRYGGRDEWYPNGGSCSECNHGWGNQEEEKHAIGCLAALQTSEGGK